MSSPCAYEGINLNDGEAESCPELSQVEKVVVLVSSGQYPSRERTGARTGARASSVPQAGRRAEKLHQSLIS